MHAPPLPELDIDLGGGTIGAEIALRVLGQEQPIGSARISGDREQAQAFHMSGLPVVDRQGALIGVLSRTDLMALAGDPRFDAWQGKSIVATMTAPGLTVDADAPLTDAAARMKEHRVHRLVVVESKDGHPIGILSTTDLVRAVAAGAVGTARA